MAMSWWKRLRNKKSRKTRNNHRPRGFVPTLEQLGDRILPSVTAMFNLGQGVLTVFGDNLDNNIVLSRDATGHILVNGGAV